MKVITKNGGLRLIRFDTGEDVIAKLATYAKKEKIPSASFTGIGASKKVALSYYNLKKKKYEEKTMSENLELTCIAGTIAWKGVSPIIHAHGTFSNRQFSVYGGHVKKLIVSVTCELSLAILKNKATRSFDEKTGLNLLS